MRLRCLFHSAVGALRGKPSFFRRHAAAFEIVGQQDKMRCNLAFQLFFRAIVAEEIAELGQDSSGARHGYCSSASSFSTTPDI